MAGLLQQLQRAVKAERASIAERRVDLGRHEVGVSFGQSSRRLAPNSRAGPPKRTRVRRMHAIRRVVATGEPALAASAWFDEKKLLEVVQEVEAQRRRPDALQVALD